MTSPDEEMLPLVARLARSEERAVAARELALALGVAEVLVFTRDPELGTLLPARGFRPTLPAGAPWREFLARAVTVGAHVGSVPFPDARTLTRASAIAHDDVAVLVLLGGDPEPERLAAVRRVLPLLAAALENDADAANARAETAAARAAALDERRLLAALDQARTNAATIAAENERLYRDAERSRVDAERARAVLSAVLKQLPTGVVVTDGAARELLLTNGEAERLLGRKLDGVVDARFEHGDTRPFTPEEAPLARAIAELRPVSVEVQHRRPDGAIVTLVTNAAPVRDERGGTIAFVLAFHDITERKRAEDALRASDELLRRIFESGQDGMTVLDLDGRIMVMSRAALAQLEIEDANAHVGRSWIDLWPGTNRDAARQAIGVARAGGTGRFEGSAPTIRTNQLRIFDVSVSPMLGPRELPQRLLAVSHDVTEPRRAADALREMDRRKDEFLATLAHELRNPLAPIATALELLRLRAGSAEGLAKPVEVIARQLGHMRRLVDDLLELARITRGRIRLERRRVDLVEVIRSAIEIARPLVDSKRHRLDVHLGSEPVLVRADATRLAQALSNLLNNAAKYTDPGGSISLEVATTGREVAIHIRDTGVGIPPDVLPRIFEPFVQAERTIDRSQGGLGIGLTLSRALVELHEGRIEARSEGAGRGSEFTIRLPLLREERSIEAPADATPVSEARLEILVVDDNKDAADSLAELLAATGHCVEKAYDAETALELVRARSFDFMILDVGLPRTDGYALAREVRRLRGEVPGLIALTGYGQPEDRRRAAEAGFDHHLLKPMDVGELARILASRVPSRPSGA